MEARAGGALRGAGDGLQVPAASRWRRESVGKVGGNAHSAGFGRPLFSPGLARRDCAVALWTAWITGGCTFGWNVRRVLEVVFCGLAALLFDVGARQGWRLGAKRHGSVAWLLISFGVQSSSPPAATCRPVASRTLIPRIYPQLMEMRACGSGSRALWTLVPIGRPPLAQ